MARRIAPQIEICTIAPRAGLVTLANGLKLTADYGIDDAPSCDLVIVTGGPGNAGICSSRACGKPHRVGMHGRHDTGCERRPERWSRDHQARSGAAGN